MIPSSWKGDRGGEEMLAMRWNAVDTAGFPGRTFGLELEGRKQNRRGNDPAAWT